MKNLSLESFQAAVSALEGNVAIDVHANLLRAWSEPTRHYHTTQHLDECLALAYHWGENLTPATRAMLVLALWFHDAVYDTHGDQNEELSAQLARRELAKLGVSLWHCERIANLVRATEHSVPVPRGDLVTDLLLDIDLAILGAPAERFAEYESQIQAEYSWVAADAYTAGRGKVLDHFRALAFTEPSTLFRTAAGRTLLAQARENLSDVVIYVDLDDVLAEFYGTAAQVLGAPFQSMSPVARWSRLEQVQNLFRHLPVRPDALELWNGLKGQGRRHILTAAPRPTGFLHTAPADKLAWVREHICAAAPVLVAESGLHKAAWAHPRAILIDNLGRNIDAWTAAGGIGIVHTSARETLSQLAVILQPPHGLTAAR